MIAKIDTLVAAKAAADRFVHIHGVDFGFDIGAFCVEIAEVKLEYIPGNLDAVVLGLIGKPNIARPVIILNSERADLTGNCPSYKRRRTRFTLAHELGHIEMAWHAGLPVRACLSESETGQTRLESAEREAHYFARRILVPQQKIEQLLATASHEEVLDQLGLADVHYSVALRSLAESLAPGNVFLAFRGGVVESAFKSPGTHLVVPRKGASTTAARRLDQIAESRAEGNVGDRSVTWWSFTAREVAPAVLVSKNPKDVFADILDSLDLEDALRKSLQGSVQGKVSTTIGRVRAGGMALDSEVVAAQILHNVGSDEKLAPIYDHVDFSYYVHLRAEGIVEQFESSPAESR